MLIRFRGTPPTYISRLASMVILAFSSFDTGQPVLALFAISSNFALSAPGIFATTIKWLAVISKPSPTFSAHLIPTDADLNGPLAN